MMKWVAFIVLFFTALTMVLQIFIGGLINLETNVDSSQQEEFRRVVILENLLSMQYNSSKLDYPIEQRRAVLPVEFFTGPVDDPDELGYQVKDGSYCYFERVAGLDGENFAFAVQPMYSQQNGNEDYRRVGCTEWPRNQPSVHSPALLRRDAYQNPQLPVRLYVYEVP